MKNRKAFITGISSTYLKKKEIKYFKKDSNIFIEVNNIDEMKNQINYYLDNPIERENIAQNGYKEAKNKHSYQKRAEQLVNKFNQHVTVSSQKTFNTKKLTFYSNIERVANSFRKTYK